MGRHLSSSASTSATIVLERQVSFGSPPDPSSRGNKMPPTQINGARAVWVLSDRKI